MIFLVKGKICPLPMNNFGHYADKTHKELRMFYLVNTIIIFEVYKYEVSYKKNTKRMIR